METATLTKAEESHIERMSESFSEPTMEERSKDWFARTIQSAKKEEKESKYAPREITLKEFEEKPEVERDWMKGVAQGEESAKESPIKSAAEKDTAKPGEQRLGGETNSRVAPKEQGKLTQTEATAHWRRISAGTNPEWQKVVGPELEKALGGIPNSKEVMEHLAARPEVLHNAKSVHELRAAVHVTAEVRQALARHPDAEAKIKSATNDIVTKAPPFMGAFINDSEVLGEFLYALADQTTLNNLLETARANPGKALRVLRDMELDIKKALSNEKAPATRPRAPKPPSELPGRSSAAGDEGTFNGNFRNLSDKMHQRYFAQR